jgi:hypothetical protein
VSVRRRQRRHRREAASTHCKVRLVTKVKKAKRRRRREDQRAGTKSGEQKDYDTRAVIFQPNEPLAPARKSSKKTLKHCFLKVEVKRH